MYLSEARRFCVHTCLLPCQIVLQSPHPSRNQHHRLLANRRQQAATARTRWHRFPRAKLWHVVAAVMVRQALAAVPALELGLEPELVPVASPLRYPRLAPSTPNPSGRRCVCFTRMPVVCRHRVHSTRHRNARRWRLCGAAVRQRCAMRRLLERSLSARRCASFSNNGCVGCSCGCGCGCGCATRAHVVVPLCVRVCVCVCVVRVRRSSRRK